MVFLWASIAIMTLCAEILTVALVCIWFTLGAAVALLAAFFGAPEWLQWALFAVVSATGVALFRRLWSKQKTELTATNLDRYIGETVIVTEEIDNLNGTGEVKISGQFWKAKSQDKSHVPAEAKVTVLGFAGSKAIIAYEPQFMSGKEEE